MSENKKEINPEVVVSSTINVEKEVWKRFRKEVIEREVTLRDALEEAFRLWLGEAKDEKATHEGAVDQGRIAKGGRGR